MSNDSQAHSNQHALFAVLLGIVGLLILLVFITIRSQGDNASTTSAVGNALPTVDTVVVGPSTTAADITLTEGTTTTVTVSGNYTDTNSCHDVADTGHIKVQLGRQSAFSTGGTGPDCGTYDDNHCIVENVQMASGVSSGSTHWSCTVSNCTTSDDTTGSYVCTAPLQYYMTPTDAASRFTADKLKATVIMSDAGGAGAATGNTSQELNTTDALSLDATTVSSGINYGSIALGGTSAEKTVVVTNSGNSCGDNVGVCAGIKVQISGSDMTGSGCTTTIDKGQQRWDINAGTAWTGQTALTGSPVNMVMSMPKANTSTAVTASTYWKLKLPTTGVGGTCAGTVTYSPVRL